MAPVTAFLLCLLAATSDGFDVRKPAHLLSRTALAASTSLPRIQNVDELTAAQATATTLPLSSGTAGIFPTDLKPPAALYQGAVAAGADKASHSFGKIFRLGIASGVHIGFGIFLVMTVGGNCPQIASTNPGLQKMIMGAFGLPVGLLMTLVSGGQLFTGNTALVTGACMEGKITKQALAKNLIAAYLGNFVGAVLLASLAFYGGTLGTSPAAVTMATAKCSLPWGVAFTRGILGNWLVCMAVYMASGTSSMIGKITAVWFPISAFVALSLEHSVANMCLIPLGILRGADITIAQMFLKNLIPVTLGNIVGGAIGVMALFGTTHGNWFKRK